MLNGSIIAISEPTPKPRTQRWHMTSTSTKFDATGVTMLKIESPTRNAAVVISGETPSSISIGTAIGAIALHLADADPISRSNTAETSSSATSSAARGIASVPSQAAPSIARIGPRFDQVNIAMKCAAKNAITR
jgi:hypothetical protein